MEELGWVNMIKPHYEKFSANILKGDCLDALFKITYATQQSQTVTMIMNGSNSHKQVNWGMLSEKRICLVLIDTLFVEHLYLSINNTLSLSSLSTAFFYL